MLTILGSNQVRRIMYQSRIDMLSPALVTMVCVLAAWPIHAEPTATLSLDGLSFISFEGYENLALPGGSSIVFEFGIPTGGSLPFTIQPEGVVIPDVSLDGSEGETLRYGLDGPAHGALVRESDGVRISFSATVTATIVSADGGGEPFRYPLVFTTEVASAANAQGTNTVELEGMRLIEGPNHVQLVSATTNKTSAVPEPGRAVYSVLSGTFDSLPTIP